MHKTIQNLIYIEELIKSTLNGSNNVKLPKIIAVSKTFKIDKILPLVEHGHIDYGENKVQEAVDKWTDIKSKNSNIKLHLIGKLQTNKVKSALKIFDYIHSLDSEKLAIKISSEQLKENKKPKLFIQVNIGNEEQKSGINLNDSKNFYHYCANELSLDVVGLMCLPPINSSSQEYFNILKKNAEALGLAELSMGMSSDYESAVLSGASYLRLGTAILGPRVST